MTLKYGEKVGWFSSLLVLVISVPAAYILILGVIVQLFTGWELWICISFGAFLSLVFLFKGGFKADVYTNSVQFILMYLGFFVLIFFTISRLGSPAEMLTHLPHAHKTFTGNAGIQLIIVWFLISLQTFVDPSFHQRCSAVKTPSVAKKGVLISVLFWVLFDLMTLTAGLYSRAFFDIPLPVSAFTVLGESVLPVFWKGFFVVSLLATVMSTLDSYAFISAVTIGNDILSPLLKKIKPEKSFSAETLTKWGLLLTSVAGVFMAIILPSAVQLIYKTASVAIPGLLVPLMLSYSGRFEIQKKQIFILMLSSVALALFWMFSRAFDFIGIAQNNILGAVEPMLPGLILSVIFALIFVKKKRVSDEKRIS